MKKINFCLLSVLSILVLSCSTGEDKNGGVSIMTLKLEAGDSTCTERMFMSILDTIIIKDRDATPLRSIAKVVQIGDTLYILDDRADALYLYDKAGCFVSKIGEKGKGRKEYLRIEDFTVDKQSKKVIILSNNSKIVVYNNDGSFITSKTLCKSLIYKIHSTSWGYIATTLHRTYTEGDDAYLLYCFDKNFKQISKNIRVLPVQISAPNFVSSVFQQVNDKLYFFDPFQGLIYDVTQSENIHVVSQIDIPNRVPIETLSSAMNFMQNQHKYNWMMDCILFADCTFTSYIYDDNYSMAVFDANGKPMCMGALSQGTIPTSFHSNNGAMVSPITIEDESQDELFGIIEWQINNRQQQPKSAISR